jgi:hypothetical protein
VPPLIVKVAEVWPAGIVSFQNFWPPATSVMPVTGVPLVRVPSVLPPPPPVPPQLVGAVPTLTAAHAQLTASVVAWS